MKNQSLQKNNELNTIGNEFSPEDFSGINQIVENLITSIENSKQTKGKTKKSVPRKKWKKSPKKEKKIDLGIRELPFTF